MMRRMQRDATMRRMLTTAAESPMDLEHMGTSTGAIRGQKQSTKHVRLQEPRASATSSDEEAEEEFDFDSPRDHRGS